MPKDFLLEIGTEPLPARFIQPALDQLLARAQEMLKEERLSFSGAKTCGTLRRLTLTLSAVEDKSPSLHKKIAGPPARLLKDAEGRFTPQAEGFAKKQGVAASDLKIETTPKGDFLSAEVTVPGEPAAKILAVLLPKLIGSLEFPKTLEWEPTRLRFGRPIRTLTALLGKNVIPFTLAGIKSGRAVCGLASEGKKPIALAEPARYLRVLRDALVLADVDERRQALQGRLEASAKAAGGLLDSEGLFEETVYMTEHPVPVTGSFKESYLGLPQPLLALVLKKQLKFFPLASGTKLLARFVGVRDGVSEGQAQVRGGYERVLEARLADAAFFLARDLKTPLEGKLPMLDRVTYQKALGTMGQKAQRVTQLTLRLCESLREDQPVNEEAAGHIARLAYADLVCEVVKEFPELQGAIGGFYARAEGLDERVALGLEEFYYPVASRSPVPATAEGALASLAGKLDSLAGSFAAGVVPTGSADPFGLRRQAAGVVRILLERQLPIDLGWALRQALALQPIASEAAAAEKTADELTEFIWARAQSLFEDMGYRVDEIRSVRAGAFANIPRTLLRLAAIHSVRKHPEFEPLAAAFKRAANILRQAKVGADDSFAPERHFLQEEAELSLFDSLVWMEGQVQEKIFHGGFEDCLRALVALKPQVDRFFDGVMVMAEDPGLRRQRLALLGKLVRLFKTVADLSEIQAPAPATTPLAGLPSTAPSSPKKGL